MIREPRDEVIETQKGVVLMQKQNTGDQITAGEAFVEKYKDSPELTAAMKSLETIMDAGADAISDGEHFDCRLN